MKKKTIKRILFAVLLIVISNIPIVSFMIGYITGDKHINEQPDYLFTSGKGGFTSGGGYGDPVKAIAAFQRYKKEHPADSVLYRNKPTINLLKFWFWREYLVEDVYKFPYRKEEPLGGQ